MHAPTMWIRMATAGACGVALLSGQLCGCKPCLPGPFAAPSVLAEVNSADFELSPSVSADGLSLFLASNRTAGLGGYDLWVATRSAPSGAFGAPENLAEVNSADSDSAAVLSADGLTLFFTSDRGGGVGNYDLWFAVRPDAASAFGAPENLAEVNSADTERSPFVTADGLTLYFFSDRPPPDGGGQSDLWFAVREDAAGAFAEPQPVPGINTAALEEDPLLSEDGNTLVFSSDRPDGAGGSDLWAATWQGEATGFGAAAPIAEINSAYQDAYPSLSADGLTLYFASRRPGGAGEADIWSCVRGCLEE